MWTVNKKLANGREGKVILFAKKTDKMKKKTMASNSTGSVSSIIAKDVVKERVLGALRKDGIALRILFQNAFASDSDLMSDIGLTIEHIQVFQNRRSEFQKSAEAFIEEFHGIEFLEGNKKDIVLIQNSRKASSGGLNFHKCPFSIAETNVLVGLHTTDVNETQSNVQRHISQGIWARILQRGWGVFRQQARTAVDLKDRWRSITGLREVNHFADPIHEGKAVRKLGTIGTDLAGLLIADVQMSSKKRYRSRGPSGTNSMLALYEDDSDSTHDSESQSHPSAACHSVGTSSGTDTSTAVNKNDGSIWGGAEFANE